MRKPDNASNHAPPLVSYAEVQKHTSEDSCWVIVRDQVYDATSILDSHPGGKNIILKNAGKDVTKLFVPVHPPDTLATGLPPEAHLGPVDVLTLPKTDDAPTEDEVRIAEARKTLPPPEAVQNIPEIAVLAQKVLSRTAWAYYRSAGDDNITFDENTAAYRRYWFRPRVMRKISQVSTVTSMLSFPTSLPIFICPAAMARLGHPDGEMNLTRAAGKEQIIQGVSINASCSLDEIMSVRQADQTIFFQIYLNRDRAASKKLLQELEPRGFKAIILTVDAVVAGKRELDRRTKDDFTAAPAHGKSPAGGLGVAHAISGYQDPDILWEDVVWIQSLTKLPLIIKGIQCVEDAEKAYDHGVQGIILSNHGGRSLDFAPPGMVILEELYLRRPELLRKFEVYIDGGVTRGTDVLKALCLGAKAVGLGRAFLYANGVWGEDGCRRVIEILREEITMGMQFLGVTSIDQLTPELLRLPAADFRSRL